MIQECFVSSAFVNKPLLAGSLRKALDPELVPVFSALFATALCQLGRIWVVRAEFWQS